MASSHVRDVGPVDWLLATAGLVLPFHRILVQIDKDPRKRLAIPGFVLSVALVASSASPLVVRMVQKLLFCSILAHAGARHMHGRSELIATFSGPSPVGPLSSWIKADGIFMAYFGLVWIAFDVDFEPPWPSPMESAKPLWEHGSMPLTVLIYLWYLPALSVS